MPNDLDHGLIELMANGAQPPPNFDYDDLLTPMAQEISRRRSCAIRVHADLEVLDNFICRPVNRISHPKTVEAIERIMIASLEAGGQS